MVGIVSESAPPVVLWELLELLNDCGDSSGVFIVDLLLTLSLPDAGQGWVAYGFFGMVMLPTCWLCLAAVRFNDGGFFLTFGCKLNVFRLY